MKRYFERRRAEFDSLGQVFRAPLVERADPIIYLGQPDENDIVEWAPREKEHLHVMSNIEHRLGVRFHNSIADYFNSYWFLVLGGRSGPWCVQLRPVVPGVELDEFLADADEFANSHEGKLPRTPIGIETNTGFTVLVDNQTGRVELDNTEKNVLEPLAENLADLIETLR